MLHDILYTSAKKADGSYDFSPYFKEVKSRLQQADVTVGDFEGTISPDYPLSGYPLFNAPEAIADTLEHLNYDVIDLGHNHILDSGLSGAIQTANAFKERGMSTIGFYPEGRDEEGILLKEIKGIKMAFLAYSYGFNGLDDNLSKAQKEKHLATLDEAKIKADLKKAEELADVTIVMPQMGVEYDLEPSQEQIDLYHQMIDWGADLILGGHPHVVQPTETLLKDGEKKLIVYSMGNFISNQTFEMMANKWPERGSLVDITFEKKEGKTVLKTAQIHPTLVEVTKRGVIGSDGYELADYRILVLEDFIKGGSRRHELDASMIAKVDLAYQETNDLLALDW